MAKRHGAQFWRAHVQAWEQGELTQAAYCAAQGLRARSFYRWRCGYGESGAESGGSLTLVPVRVGAGAPAGVVRLHSPGGWRIEVPAERAGWLIELLRALP